MEPYPKCRKSTGKWGKEGYEITSIEFIEEEWAEMKIKGSISSFWKSTLRSSLTHSLSLSHTPPSSVKLCNQSSFLSCFLPRDSKVPFSFVFVWLDRY
jgi:hypothetical protein